MGEQQFRGHQRPHLTGHTSCKHTHSRKELQYMSRSSLSLNLHQSQLSSLIQHPSIQHPSIHIPPSLPPSLPPQSVSQSVSQFFIISSIHPPTHSLTHSPASWTSRRTCTANNPSSRAAACADLPAAFSMELCRVGRNEGRRVEARSFVRQRARIQWR